MKKNLYLPKYNNIRIYYALICFLPLKWSVSLLPLNGATIRQCYSEICIRNDKLLFQFDGSYIKFIGMFHIFYLYNYT